MLTPEQIVKFVESKYGKQQLKETATKVRESNKDARKAEILDPDFLRKPMRKSI